MFSVYYVTGSAILNILQSLNIFNRFRETVHFTPFGEKKVKQFLGFLLTSVSYLNPSFTKGEGGSTRPPKVFSSITFSKNKLGTPKFALSNFKQVPLLAILMRNISSNFFHLSCCQYVSTTPEKKLCYRPSQYRHFVGVCTEKMMDRQYRENGARNIYSNYNQMKAYAECSPNQSKKL